VRMKIDHEEALRHEQASYLAPLACMVGCAEVAEWIK